MGTPNETEKIVNERPYLQGKQKFAFPIPYHPGSEINALAYDQGAENFLWHRQNEAEFFDDVVFPVFKHGVNDHLRDGGTLLDVHTGTSYLVHKLVQLHKVNPEKIKVLDISKKMLELGEQEINTHHPDLQVDFFQGSTTYMSSIDDNSVDVLTSAYGYDYTPIHEIPQSMSEIKRVLRYGGRGIIVIPSHQRNQEYYLNGHHTPSSAGEYPEGTYYEKTYGLGDVLVAKSYLSLPSWINRITDSGLSVVKVLQPVLDNTMMELRPDITSEEARKKRVTAFVVEKPHPSNKLPQVFSNQLLESIKNANSDEEAQQILSSYTTSLAAG